jgi:hypothetical protein
MFRLVISAASLACATVCATACAAAPAANPQASASGAAKQAEGAAPNQLFPPLPPLASLPPSSAEEVEEDSTRPSPNGHHVKKTRHPIWHKSAETQVHVIVSDESHAYLAAVDRKLDEVLQGNSHDPRVQANGAFVAMSR